MSLDRFKFKGEIYEVGGAADVTLRDLMLLEQETRDLGWTLHMGEIVRLGELFQTLTKDEAKVHPEAARMLAVTIWLGLVKKLRDVGDYDGHVPFADAIDASLADFEPIAVPALQDHADPQKPRPAKKRTTKKSASGRSGSGRGGARATGGSRKD